ncbi:hypothetical protein DYU11_19385 [Fibrisoma montanum]|uniref:Uncharacterized protein n=1 Tax=Fibrisoma montanum TaxID=2305895 RepID=A0A418M6Y5_9BACT|nr:hypothetical protein [Fibrisoma montanum]RIV21566.1 hypothetical protein DYU11_19385 [Fibrisoma montanum]
MATITHSTATYTSNTQTGWLTAYNQFIEKAEFNRIGWAATVLTIQGCVLSPALLLIMAYFGGGDWQFLVGNLSFLMVLIPILAAQPVKYIFPAFALSLLLHAALILVNLLY